MTKTSYSSSGGLNGDKACEQIDVDSLLSLAKGAYWERGFDALGELLDKYVDHYDVNSRIKVFLKPGRGKEDMGGDLLGYLVPKLEENVSELRKGKMPHGPSENEPGTTLAGARGYEGWFALIGRWAEKTAEFLDKKVIGKYEHVRDLESQSDAEFEKYHKGVNKKQFLQERVLKRLSWEGDMIVKEAIDAIYSPSNKGITAINVLARVPGITCGDKTAAQEGVVGMDPEIVKTLDDKLNDAKFRTKFEFYQIWGETKDSFVEDIMPKLHAMYEGAVKYTVSSMDMDELRFRYYQNQSPSELLGKTDSIKGRLSELGSQKEKLVRYNEELSKGWMVFSERVNELNEKVREPKLKEIDEKLVGLESAHPEIAHLAKEIFPDSRSGGRYQLRLGADENPYLRLTEQLREKEDRLKKAMEPRRNDDMSDPDYGALIWMPPAPCKGWLTEIDALNSTIKTMEGELGIVEYNVLEEGRAKLEEQFKKCEGTLGDQLKVAEPYLRLKEQLREKEDLLTEQMEPRRNDDISDLNYGALISEPPAPDEGLVAEIDGLKSTIDAMEKEFGIGKYKNQPKLDLNTSIANKRAERIRSILEYNKGSMDEASSMAFDRIGEVGNRIDEIAQQQEKWKKAHGVEDYAKLIGERNAISKEQDHDQLALQESSFRIYSNVQHLNSMKTEMEQLLSRLGDIRQSDELHEMLWGTGRYEGAPISMKTFRQSYSEVESLLSAVSKEKLAEERAAIAQREKYLASHPTSREKLAASKERYRLELEKKKPGASEAIPSLYQAIATTGETG